MRYAREPDVINVAKGNNTYQIVHTGNSDIAMAGLGLGRRIEAIEWALIEGH